MNGIDTVDIDVNIQDNADREKITHAGGPDNPEIPEEVPGLEEDTDSQANPGETGAENTEEIIPEEAENPEKPEEPEQAKNMGNGGHPEIPEEVRVLNNPETPEEIRVTDNPEGETVSETDTDESGQNEAARQGISAERTERAEKSTPVKRGGRRELQPPVKKSQAQTRQTQIESSGGKPVMIYILLLFSVALLLMGLSSLMHQRSNQEVLGQLRSDLSDMREARDFQQRIIELQEARQESEDQLKEAQRNLAAVVSQTREDRNRSEALQYLYLLMMEFQMEHYQSCQALIQEMESLGLEANLPGDTAGSAGLAAGVVSPMDRYYQIKEAISARIAEGLPAQTAGSMDVDMESEWIPEQETGQEPEIPESPVIPETEPENGGEESDTYSEWEPGEDIPESPVIPESL